MPEILFLDTRVRYHPRSSCTLSRRLYVPEKVSFLITLRYVDVMRQTNTDLEHAAESTVNDCWNVAGTPMLSNGWVGCVRFQVLRTRLPSGYKSVD